MRNERIGKRAEVYGTKGEQPNSSREIEAQKNEKSRLLVGQKKR